MVTEFLMFQYENVFNTEAAVLPAHPKLYWNKIEEDGNMGADITMIHLNFHAIPLILEFALAAVTSHYVSQGSLKFIFAKIPIIFV